MAKYRKQEGSVVAGAWLDKSKVVDGSKCKLVSETIPVESQWEGKTIKNNVAKIRFQGEQGEAKNTNVNIPSINALIDAYGEDSKDWQGHILTAKIKEMLVGGRLVNAMYLIPDGYQLSKDEGGYLVIVKKPDNTTSAGTPVPFSDDEIDPKDSPFDTDF